MTINSSLVHIPSFLAKHTTNFKSHFLAVEYCKSRNFQRCNSPKSVVWWREIFGKPVFQVSVPVLYRHFRFVLFSVKNIGTEVIENKTPPKISALPVYRNGADIRYLKVLYYYLGMFPLAMKWRRKQGVGAWEASAPPPKKNKLADVGPW